MQGLGEWALTDKQPNLFGEAPPVYEELVKESPGNYYASFLPGLKPEEGYREIESIAELEALNKECHRCHLREGCNQAVFADGDPEADIMMVGEGPGQMEDEIGRPFVGKAGQLLDKILEAVEFERSKIYITNVVKCRPPGNRLPNPDEIAVCRGFLEAQIRMVKPKLLVCLGALATQNLVDSRAKITLVRGKWFIRQGIMIMPTYHPAALLRNQSLKRPVWEDFKLIRQETDSKGLKR